MAEEIIQEGQTPVKPEGAIVDEPKKPEISVEIQEQIKAAVEESTKLLKSQISGLDQANSKLQTELKTKELEGKTEAEQAEALRLEKETLLAENETIRRDRLVDKALDSAELPLEFAKRIIGVDESEIVEDIKTFQELIEKTAQAKADKIINERLGGPSPEDGDVPKKELPRFGSSALDTLKIATERAKLKN